MIEFDLSIYDEQAICKAINDFQNIALLRTIANENNVVCLVECMNILCESVSTNEVIMEFANYVLDLSIAMRNKDRDIF